MDEGIMQKLAALEQKMDAAREAAEKTKRYFFWFLILSLLALFVPLFGMMFALPYFLHLLSGSLPVGL